jgi:hypothetical protein
MTMDLKCGARALDCRCNEDGHVETSGEVTHICKICYASWHGTYGEDTFEPWILPFSMRLSRYGQPPMTWIA